MKLKIEGDIYNPNDKGVLKYHTLKIIIDEECEKKFNKLKEKCKRYFINITDDHFWLGESSFDTIIEFF